MSVRIRYSTSEAGIKKSKQTFQAGKRRLYVVLNEKSMHFIIFDTNANVVASGGNTKNKTLLRLQAKKALEDLGVTFKGEHRNRVKKSRTKKQETATVPSMSQDDLMNLVQSRLDSFSKVLMEEISDKMPKNAPQVENAS